MLSPFLFPSALMPKPKGVAPSFTEKLQPKTCMDGDKNVVFEARFTGTEPVEIQWLKDKKSIKKDNVYNITSSTGSAKLSFGEVFPEDSGVYSVIVKNSISSVTSVAALQVKGQAVFLFFFWLI